MSLQLFFVLVKNVERKQELHIYNLATERDALRHDLKEQRCRNIVLRKQLQESKRSRIELAGMSYSFTGYVSCCIYGDT